MSLKTFNDEKMEFLIAKTGQTGDIDDLEMIWLENETGLVGTNADLWNAFLNKQGYTVGTINDRQVAWLIGDYGFSGTWNDMMRQFYIAFEDYYALTDVDAYQIKDVDGNFIYVIS